MQRKLIWILVSWATASCAELVNVYVKKQEMSDIVREQRQMIWDQHQRINSGRCDPDDAAVDRERMLFAQERATMALQDQADFQRRQAQAQEDSVYEEGRQADAMERQVDETEHANFIKRINRR